MTVQRLTEPFESLYRHAVELAASVEADAILLQLEGACDWERLRELSGDMTVLVAANEEQHVMGSATVGIAAVVMKSGEQSVYESLTQALLECLADELLVSSAKVVAVYSGFAAGEVDSISVIDLPDHLGRVTARDLRQLQTNVPLETLKMVLDLAVEIGREGREGKPVGTLFVVGDSRKVLAHSHSTGFDPVRGYSRKERDLSDPRVREGIKEVACIDGAIIVSKDGIVEAGARYLDAPASDITLSKGLGARHWAAAAITRHTKSVAIAVSESNGTVRIFHNGEVVLRVEPFRRAMKWRDFEYEPPE